ncbi:MAG: hypothetical protein ACSW75_04895, partial [Lachnospiraceae bacterium]
FAKVYAQLERARLVVDFGSLLLSYLRKNSEKRSLHEPRKEASFLARLFSLNACLAAYSHLK